MGVGEGWAVQGGREDVVLAVRGAVGEDGGGGPVVVALDGGLGRGEEGGARHFFVICGVCVWCGA